MVSIELIFFKFFFFLIVHGDVCDKKNLCCEPKKAWTLENEFNFSGKKKEEELDFKNRLWYAFIIFSDFFNVF